MVLAIPTLPSELEIIQKCREACAANPKAFIRGTPLIDSTGTPYAWVRFGYSDVYMEDARTQQYVADIVKQDDAAPVRVPAVYSFFKSQLGRGYIVMELIDGEVCSNADADLVAAAVQYLIAIKAPTDQPGPIGGGPVCHTLFPDVRSSVTYSSVDWLEKHMNGILAHVGRPQRLSLKSQIKTYGLSLCPSDMRRKNFLKDREGKIVAINFDCTCFLPISFFEVALYHHDDFTHLIRQRIVYPTSAQSDTLYKALKTLVQFGTDKLGLPRELKAQTLRQ
ncbi:hypothetical protein DFP72DRAFT_1065464 [Ephemerocybe angulata]|uniref:Aminoglycoside phosphotransferase domain-containing protein n=1 Tax=Ephemerocybe angulata TaxID=980116 RepID=A0A8H6I4C2_9AGAR|nr:hypothetical protein DFP72DRAFT_1065464 [Tulosesus angulatus]